MHALFRKARERLQRWPPAGTENSDEFRGWYSRGYLPHFDAEGIIQHITYHLGDSLPKVALEKMLGNWMHTLKTSIRSKGVNEFRHFWITVMDHVFWVSMKQQK
jgi:hypothetical protein